MRLHSCALLLVLFNAGFSIAGNGSWTRQGPYGGTLSNIAFDDVQPGVVYGLSNGRAYRSTDGGTRWRELATPIPAYEVLVQDGKVYIANGSSGGFELADSLDQGSHWNRSPATVFPVSYWAASVQALAAAPGNSSTLLLSYSRSGLYRSTDSGTTWTKLVAGLPDKQDAAFVQFDPANSRIAYAAYDTVIVKTTDAGDTWFNVTGNLKAERFLDLDIDRSNPNTVYTIPVKSATKLSMWRSQTGGKNWIRIQGSYPPILKLELDAGNSSVLHAVASMVTGTSVVESLWNSTDKGSTWKEAAAPSFRLYDSFVADPLTPSRLLLGGINMPLRSGDGGRNWSPSGAGLRELNMGTFSFSQAQPEVVYSGAPQDFDNMYRSTNSGKNWSVFLRPIGPGGIDPLGGLTVHPKNPNLIAASTDYGGLRISLDAGKSWIRKINAPIGYLHLFLFDAGETLYSFTYKSVYKSTDLGTTWNRFPIRPLAGTSQDEVVAAAVSHSNNRVLYAGSQFGRFLRSTDGGITWTLRRQFERETIERILVDHSAANLAYVQTSRSLYRTPDGGRTWARLSQPNAQAVKGIAMHPANSRILASDINGRVQITRDGGSSWQPLTQLPSADYEIHDLAFTSSTLLVATSRGVLSIDFQP